ncbi:ABC-type glycerol-3-phosphate transport system substrate-binding protein [Mycobacterium sp. MAA66]|uniref:hypothetical protein n=1 Tax=Mycobacterium sp. MAA66 TaxID=3156297 RepID=UPI003517CC29
MSSLTIRRLGVIIGSGALITSGALLAGCSNGGQPTTPTTSTTTTTTTTTSVTPTEKSINPGGPAFTPAPPEHRGNVG